MRVTEQIDALESLAVDSFGGYDAETAISGMSFRFYFDRALSAIGFVD